MITGYVFVILMNIALQMQACAGYGKGILQSDVLGRINTFRR